MRQCQVPGCRRDAEYEVFLYDPRPRVGKTEAPLQQDQTCLFICEQHASENEQRTQGGQEPVDGV
jgi:hypothetical protein